MLLRKASAGSDSYGNHWPDDGSVLEVDDAQAGLLLAIPDGGFTAVDPAGAEPTPGDPGTVPTDDGVPTGDGEQAGDEEEPAHPQEQETADPAPAIPPLAAAPPTPRPSSKRTRTRSRTAEG